jgi:hypothetical protein
MTFKEKAALLNTDGMDADSIAAVHCPAWYGLPNIEGCPKIETVQVSKNKKVTKQTKALNLCYACWNREI